jgi:hypothetical protein
MYDLIGDKALKIKDKSSVKQQIQDELGSDYYHEIEHENSKNYNDDTTSTNKVDFSPSRDDDNSSIHEASEETKYEEENDEFHILNKRQPKVTVTHVASGIKSQQQPASDSHSTPYLPPPPNETPNNGSESVVSVMSSYQEQEQPSNEYEYIQDENSMFMTPVVPSSSSHQHQLSSSSGGFGETPREGGSSIYHGDSTPTFQDLERLPSRERSLSVSDGNEFKRQRVE